MIQKFLLLLVIIPGLALGQYERPGSASAQFLKIGVSPRAAAMAGAFIAVSDGAEGTYYNPAVLALLKRTSLVASHTQWFAGIGLEYLAAAHNFGRVGAFGLSITSLHTDAMKVRTPTQPEGTGETFFSNNYRMGLSYSRLLTDHVSFGGTLNYVRLDLFNGFSEDAFGVDIAALYKTDYRGFRFGMKIANFGSSIIMVSEQYPIPLNFTFGMAINAIQNGNNTLVTSMAATKPNDGQTLLDAGVEWRYRNQFFLRAGYWMNHDVAKYTVGGGVMVNIEGSSVGVDYALSEYGILGMVNRIGVRIAL